MVSFYRGVVAFGLVGILLAAGCGSPTVTPVAKGPPPPPPAPAPAPKPAPPPPTVEKPKPDPYETAMAEMSTIIKRYPTIYVGIKDEAAADKAVAEIGRMTARLKDLAAEIGKLPPQPGQEKHARELLNDLNQLPTALLSNPDMQRVLSDPDLGLKLNVAHLSFVQEIMPTLGQVLVSRQTSGLLQPSEPQPTPATNSPKP